MEYEHYVKETNKIRRNKMIFFTRRKTIYREKIYWYIYVLTQKIVPRPFPENQQKKLHIFAMGLVDDRIIFI